MTGKVRRVLVSGSSGSIGGSLCEAFLGDGWSVVGLDMAKPRTAPANSGPWRFVECDLSDASAVEGAMIDAHGDGPFDVVINNAGVIFNSPTLAFESGKLSLHDFAAWNRVLSGTLNSAFYVSAHCAQRMISSGKQGTIINISSICAAGNIGQAAYSSAKAGVNAMTVSLSKELGPLGIRVAAVAPGFLDTESTKRALSEDALGRIKKAIPLRKLGKPRDLYHAIVFIIESDYFHGKVLELDGGLTL